MAISFGKGKVEKNETICIKMEVDKKAYARHSRALRDLPFVRGPIHGEDLEENDIVHINYTFTAQYINGVAKALNAIKELCSDPEIVVNASCDNLTQGRILFYEALKQLEAVIQEIEKR